MRTPDVHLKGLGVYLPPAAGVEQAVREGRYSAEEAELHELAGAAVAGDVPAPEMALRAAQQAFKRCGHRPEELDLLLYADSWHQGPDGWQPQYYLQRHLVGGRPLAVEVRHGCNGVFSALELAASYLRSPGRRDALVVAADNFGTPMIDRWRFGPGYIAGDAASAVLLSTEPGFARLLSVCTTAVAEAEEVHRSGEPLFPPGPTAGRPLDFSGRTADFNRRAMADGAGTTVWVTVHQRMVELVDRTLAEAGLEIGDIARAAFMNYSREIVEQRGMLALGLPMSKSTWEFGRTVGHLAASDQLVSLDHLLTAGELRPGDHMLLVGVGPGVTLSSAIVQILSTPPWLR
ncbi:ketoacyl-ACP synthase III family protein [Actinomadura geliboluensis]|uniref:3-oxoacyl-ACP synthase n=1 Tax=Actinomadura geliboluensis TaxID=882440 RepID=A0A5S4H9U6_9ACTN|nr:ketoacyl-ACP synthase III family protein [Actinomadura geliboluensis]TMR41746.1 3-oxoacyl-ACP synthase [Actinomadura geliboluensis]